MISGFNKNPFRVQKSPFVNPVYYVNGKSDSIQLDTPVITVIQDTIDDFKVTITISPITGATKYRLYINGSSVLISEATIVNYEFESNNTYQISVKATGTGYKPSGISNVETVVVTSIGTFLSTGIKYILGNLKKLLIKE